MSFDFSNINPIQKTQAAYKDGGGMGGGGMYFQQSKKRKEDEDDIFEYSDEKKTEEIEFGSEPKEEDIPHDTFVNKFVNWFRLKNK